MSNSYSSYMSIEPSTQMVVEAPKAAETSSAATAGEEDGPINDFEAGLCFGPGICEGIDHQRADFDEGFGAGLGGYSNTPLRTIIGDGDVTSDLRFGCDLFDFPPKSNISTQEKGKSTIADTLTLIVELDLPPASPQVIRLDQVSSLKTSRTTTLREEDYGTSRAAVLRISWRLLPSPKDRVSSTAIPWSSSFYLGGGRAPTLFKSLHCSIIQEPSLFAG